jgi:hypothetical protein
MNLTKYCSSIPRKWCPEKCSHLRLFLFREALGLSQLSRRGWCRDRDSNADAERSQRSRYANSLHRGIRLVPVLGFEPRRTTILSSRCLPIASDRHDGARRGIRTPTGAGLKSAASAVGLRARKASLTGFEPVSRRLGCVAVSTTKDVGGAPAASRTLIGGLEGRYRSVRPGHVGADIGSRTSRTRQRRPWQGYLTPCASAYVGACRWNRTSYLRLIGPALILMSFACECWSGRLDSNQRLLGSGPRCLPG